MSYEKPEQSPTTLFGVQNIIMAGLVQALQLGAEQETQAANLAELANRDVLTGLYNRRAIEGTFDDLVTERPGRRMADVAFPAQESTHHLMFLDLDHFKVINDTYGHPRGDQIMKNFADIL